MLLGGKLEAGAETIHYNKSQTTRPCDRGDRRVQKRLFCFCHILRLEPLWTLCNGKFYTIAFLKGLVSVTHDRRIVNKHVPAGRPLNKPKSFFIVKPLHFSHFFAH